MIDSSYKDETPLCSYSLFISKLLSHTSLCMIGNLLKKFKTECWPLCKIPLFVNISCNISVYCIPCLYCGSLINAYFAHPWSPHLLNCALWIGQTIYQQQQQPSFGYWIPCIVQHTNMIACHSSSRPIAALMVLCLIAM